MVESDLWRSTRLTCYMIGNSALKTSLKQALDARGYTSLTPVQEACSDPELSGKDLLVSAQTGSGKTVGFGIAIAPTILGEADGFERASAPLALIIAPTRELALQVKRELDWLYGVAGAKIASCVGGMDMRDERRTLERGAHIVVATPGRLRDHISRGSINLSQLRAVVLDEADEMLDLGFREDLEFILGESPDDRQTLLFSATVSAPIAKLAKSYQRDAQRISTINKAEQHSDITYFAHTVAPHDAENAIINVLRYHEAPNAIVFANTRAAVNRLITRLSNRGFSAVALSGELSQAERSHALQAMRDGRARVCVATDVAARGIDLPNLDLVVHADLPSSSETLLHRSGRTGRAGRKGASTLIVPPKAQRKAERLLREAKLSAEWVNAPSADAVRARDMERMVADPAWSEELPESQADALAQLVEKFDAKTLAAGYLRLWSAVRTAPEELSAPSERKPREERAPFGPSVWFSIAGGRDNGADPRRLLPQLCKAGGLTKSDIGAIRIQKDVSYAEILESKLSSFLETLGSDMVLDDGEAVTRLANPPKLDDRGKPPFKKGGGGFKKDGPRGGGRPHRGQSDRPRGRDDNSGKPEFAGKPAKPRGASGGKPGGKPFGKPAGKFAGKPGDKPKGPPPPKSKANSKKNKARAANSSGS